VNAAETARVELSSARRRTGVHMLRSLAISPHAWITYEIDYDAVDSARRQSQEAWRDAHGGRSLTYLPFLCFAVCRALERYPEINARYVDGSLELHDKIGLSIAIDLGPRGLVVPVIRDAGTRSVADLAVAIWDLTDRARGKRLVPDDFVGGTYTVSNPGPMGTYSSAPIINQPQSAILAIDGIGPRPIVVEAADGTRALGIGVRGLVTQAFDHRAFDGAYCAAYLRSLAEIVCATPWHEHLTPYIRKEQ